MYPFSLQHPFFDPSKLASLKIHKLALRAQTCEFSTCLPEHRQALRSPRWVPQKIYEFALRGLLKALISISGYSSSIKTKRTIIPIYLHFTNCLLTNLFKYIINYVSILTTCLPCLHRQADFQILISQVCYKATNFIDTASLTCSQT